MINDQLSVFMAMSLPQGTAKFISQPTAEPQSGEGSRSVAASRLPLIIVA